MSDFFSAGAAGFLIGGTVGLLVVAGMIERLDIPIANIEAAKAVCVGANSTLVSTDWTEATCANRAVIPFTVKK